jgi:hypothetical protein
MRARFFAPPTVGSHGLCIPHFFVNLGVRVAVERRMHLIFYILASTVTTIRQHLPWMAYEPCLGGFYSGWLMHKRSFVQQWQRDHKKRVVALHKPVAIASRMATGLCINRKPKPLLANQSWYSSIGLSAFTVPLLLEPLISTARIAPALPSKGLNP